jgi:hypothetical protein
MRTFWGINNEWKGKCEKLKPLLSHVDIIFPSIYILYLPGQVSYIAYDTYIRDNVGMALKLGVDLNKPVIPFIWDRVAGSNKQYKMSQLTDNVFKDYISKVLSTTYNNKEIAGVVWWGAPKYYYRKNIPQYNKEGKTEAEYINETNNYILRNGIAILNQIDSL